MNIIPNVINMNRVLVINMNTFLEVSKINHILGYSISLFYLYILV